MTIFGVYKQYPFPIPLRVKFFNLFRYFFKFSYLETYLISQLEAGQAKFWRRLIPPLYFYKSNSVRMAERNQIRFKLDISKLLDHSIYFYTVKDVAWENLFKVIRPDFRIIDVGANIGFLSLTFAKLCPQGDVYSFEPDGETFSKLQQNVDANKFTNIKVFRMAMGDQTGTGQLYKLYLNNPGANRILSQKPAGSVASEPVQIGRLDDFEKDGCFDGVSLIKIDVEGFELFVIKGALHLISRWRPILFVELVDENLTLQGCSGKELVDYIKSLGYVILDARSMLPLKESNRYYTDIICIPTQK